jgi:amino acid permease
VSDLGTVLAVVGATGSTMVSYVIPGACYYKLFPHKHFKRTLALLQFSLGVMIIPLALTAIAFYASSE